MADIQQILSKLEKVTNKGRGKWMARCPAHDDRSPSLSVKVTEDDKILINCFAGCAVDEIVGSVGLTLADLMPDNPDHRKWTKPPKFNKFELFDRVTDESTILLLAVRQLLADNPLNNHDLKRVIQAENTIDHIIRETR